MTRKRIFGFTADDYFNLVENYCIDEPTPGAIHRFCARSFREVPEGPGAIKIARVYVSQREVDKCLYRPQPTINQKREDYSHEWP